MAAPLVSAGQTRGGIHELLDDCSSFSEHIRKARRGTFPLSAETPPPKDTRTASLFLRDTPPAEISRFWDNQLSRLERLIGDYANDQLKWNKCIRPEIAAAAGGFETVAISQLFRRFGLQGQRWMWQFANGFPIAGSLSQKPLFPGPKKDVSRIRQSELYDTARARFKERARRCGANDAQDISGEAIAQGGMG